MAIQIVFEIDSISEDNEHGIGHVATRWALEHFLNGTSLPQLVTEEFVWRPRWEYRMG